MNTSGSGARYSGRSVEGGFEFVATFGEVTQRITYLAEGPDRVRYLAHVSDADGTRDVPHSTGTWVRTAPGQRCTNQPHPARP